MRKKMILLALSMISVLYSDEIVIWQAFSKNTHNTNTDITIEPFNVQGRVTSTKEIANMEAVFYRYEAEVRRAALELYYKDKMNAIFQGELTAEANETDLMIVAHLVGGGKVVKKISLVNFSFIKNADFDNYGLIKSKRVHKDSVTAMAFSRNNRYLVSGADDNYARILDPKSLKVLHSLRGHSGYVKSVAITPDDKYVLSGGQDGTIRVWDIRTGKKIKVIKAHRGPVNTISISNSGKYAISGSHNALVALWDLTTYKKIRDYPDSSTTRTYLSSTFSSDDRYTILGCSRKRATIFNAIDGTYVKYNSSDGPIHGVAMTRDMRHIYSGAADEKGRVKWIRTLFTPNQNDEFWMGGSYLWTAIFKMEHLGSDPKGAYKTMSKGHPIKGFDSPVEYLGLSGDGKFIMYVVEAGKMRISETETGFGRYSTSLYREASGGAFSFDGKLAAIGELNGKINVYGLP